MWNNPDTGKMEAGAMSQAPKGSNPAQLGMQEVKDIMNARHAVQIMTKQGDPNDPVNQGTLQLIDSLDKDGKLGVLASRWNSFMTTGVGTVPGDDPRIISLLDKNMLGDTATMLSHFGASGGRSPQMLQHFLDLADSRKMDGPTLKAGVRAIADYMTDKAMYPGGAPPTGRMAPLSSGAGGSPSGPKVGDIQKGYRFLGGDPSKQQSWMKVGK
jgi:hypothetical protein